MLKLLSDTLKALKSEPENADEPAFRKVLREMEKFLRQFPAGTAALRSYQELHGKDESDTVLAALLSRQEQDRLTEIVQQHATLTPEAEQEIKAFFADILNHDDEYPGIQAFLTDHGNNHEKARASLYVAIAYGYGSTAK